MKELLENNMLVTKALQKWFTARMRKAVQMVKDENWIEQFVKEEISLERLVPVLSLNPRSLFDFFDEHQVYIIPTETRGYFSAMINGKPINDEHYSLRLDVEIKAVELAFPILQKKLENNE